MSKFTYDDIVKVFSDPSHASKPQKAWVVGIFETDKEPGPYWRQFSPGVVYTVEFEDGSSIQTHENTLELWE